MSYSDIAAMVDDWDLRMRLIACAAQEQPDDPIAFAEANIWRICAQPGWSDSWAKVANAIANDPDYKPGADEKVISDAKILSGMQKVIKDLTSTVTAKSRAMTDDVAAQQQAEDDRHFARQVRMREWELEHMPEPPTLTFPAPPDPAPPDPTEES